MEKMCKTCAFYEADKKYDYETKVFVTAEYGNCRKNPPVVFPSENMALSFFPAVDEYIWRGEYKEKTS